ncbi:MAG TPA: N-acetyl-1-D-myo-inositol-2-amino-2-deoxy-alpha-D-glucopyranoside deacetylase [Chloroflexota bacterium]|nr:N-acetyl-1-D-myo-inositol-2-amino-2-deoxy-alpha-D-glucopyranoside deacetylase [Chloroflexota bacterium]
MASRQRVLMAVHAHPDDECLGTGGILARYSAEGVRTVLVTCTDGAVGEISDAALATPDNLALVRAGELDESVRILGISRLVKLGYRDSGMQGTPDNEHPASFHQADFDGAVGKIVGLMREERPDVVVTYDENGGYGHPDHVRAHQVAVAAFAAAGDPRRFPDAGTPWSPARLYYAVIARSSFPRFIERLREAGIESPFTAPSEVPQPERPVFGVSDDRVTTRVDVSQYVETKRLSLAAHRTQMGPDQFFMRIPPELFGEFFGRETFQRVGGPEDGLAEDDLFAGLDG